jgi:YfiR/HmsC-like
VDILIDNPISWNPSARLARAIGIVALLLGPLCAQPATEYEVKAAFLCKFASFVEWPHQSADGRLCIGIVGQDPFGADLDRIVAGKSIGGRAFQIRRFKPGQEVGACEIVFVSASERTRLPHILEHLKGSATLTVGDVPEFCENGGMINLRMEGERIHLEINLESVERSSLHLSSKLLNLGSVTHSSAGTGSR